MQPKVNAPLVTHQPIREAAGVLFPLRHLLAFTAVNPPKVSCGWRIAISGSAGWWRHEDGNVVSERWLHKAGFDPTSGPDGYTLDNGRVVRSWREHTDDAAVLKCPWLTDAGQARVRVMVPVSPAPDDLAGQLNAALWQRGQEGTDDSCLRCRAPVD